MTSRGYVSLFAVFTIIAAIAALTAPAYAQLQTGALTGRAQDNSGALVPGVEVIASSPAMIGGPRTSVTDEQGSYRFTLLPPGVYRVTFSLPGFKTLNVDGIVVTTGTTMTINSSLEVAALAEEVTVTSEVPAIDLEAATVGVNWSQQKLDNLPFGRAIRGLVGLVPGVYTTGYDVGGNTKGGSSGTGGRTFGRSGGDVQVFDGVYWDGFFGEYGSYSEVQISTAAKGAESMNPGTSYSFVIKSGGNDFHGSIYADWQDGSFQSSNISKRLLDEGFSPTGNKFTRSNDMTAEIGGPILRNKFWFYSSYGDTYVGQLVPGFISLKTNEPAVFFTTLKSPTLKLTFQLTPNMKLDSTAHWNKKWAPYRTGDAFTPLEATQNQRSWLGVGPTLGWTYVIGPTMTANAGIRRSGYFWPDDAWTDDVRTLDLTTRQNRGAYQKQYRRPTRWQWDGAFSWFADIAGKKNEIKSGFLGVWHKHFVDNIGFPNQQVYRYRSLPGDTNLFQRPDSVLVYDFPNFVIHGERYDSWFINDKITWNRKLTLNVGVRFERYSSWLPEQGNPGTGPWSTKNVFPERRDFPVLTRWVPRTSFVYDVRGDGKLALKASYGRYAASVTGSSGITPAPTANNVNPNAGTTWTYSNWNGSIPYIPRPQDLVSVSGGTGGGRRLDPNLKLPYMDEYTAGFELGLSRDYTVRFNVVRKTDYLESKTIDLAMPFSAYTDVRYAVDPGRDNVTGTADDTTMQAWSVPRTHPRFGQTDQLITNVGEREGVDLYTAYETTFNKQYSNGWSFMIGYVADFAKRRNPEPQNPNELVYNWQLPIWSYTTKMNGQYDLPWGLMYSATYQIQSGEYYGRQAQVRNALNSLVTVEVEGQVGRYDYVKMLDNRVSKSFRINDRHSIEGILDVFNMLNSSAVLTRVTLNGPNYMKPLATGSGATVALPIIPPRIMRLGVRWRF